MLDVFRTHGHERVDTARVHGEGSSEEYLVALQLHERGIVVDAKLYPTVVHGGEISLGVSSDSTFFFFSSLLLKYVIQQSKLHDLT